MGKFDYDLEASFSPDVGRRGDNMTLTVKVNNLEGEIKELHFSIQQYGISQVFEKEKDNVFSYTMDIPWEAPPADYEIAVYAVSPDFQWGPQKIFKYTVS
jgi:hypothetical protein